MAPSKSHRSRVKRHGLKRKTIARKKAKEQTKNTSLSRISPISFTVSASHPSSATSAKPLLGTIIPPALIEEPPANSSVCVCQTPDNTMMQQNGVNTVKPKMKSFINKSAAKIVGNGYLKNALQKRKRTRRLSVKYGLSKNKEIVKASGYKLQDFTIFGRNYSKIYNM